MTKPWTAVTGVLLALCACVTAAPPAASIPKETINVPECAAPPVIDGRENDACWEKAAWHPIDQVWIPWGGKMDPADYGGRYKLAWSSVTDRLYFLVEITDDVLVDGYVYPMPQYHNWDVLEIFFDENASGGDHTLNQNAFAYHITAGNSQVGYQAMDLGPDWEVMNYSSHLECVIGKPGQQRYVWEIGLIVYNDKFRPGRRDNPTVQLEAGKECGLSLAYCDNDDPTEQPKTRDNFIGSVWVPQANYNDHWQNADWFGRIRLVAAE
jgi:hypothetical protein